MSRGAVYAMQWKKSLSRLLRLTMQVITLQFKGKLSRTFRL
jgi:hypothetical protein